MNKTPSEIAKALLERRNRMTHVILPGEMTAEIGPDGMSEALKNRWLVPDTEDSGFLRVSHDLGVIEEMRRIASMKPEEYTPEVIPVSEGHAYAILHTNRGHALHEVAAPMTGHPSPGLSSIGQPQAPMAPQSAVPPQSQPALGSQQGNNYSIGTQVTVARAGLSANGMIEKLMPDGRFQVGFAAGHPKPAGDNVYSKEEFTPIPGSSQQSVTPPKGMPVTAIK